jgi:hypothetical protein
LQVWVIVSKRAVAISPWRLRLPKLILRHCTAVAQDPLGYLIGRFHYFHFQKGEESLEVDKQGRRETAHFAVRIVEMGFRQG